MIKNSMNTLVEFDMDQANKAAKRFDEWIYNHPVETAEISDVCLSIWGYRAALSEIDDLRRQLNEAKDQSDWDTKPVSELLIIQDEIKHQEFLLQTAQARIKFLQKKEQILNLKIESKGNYGHNCKNWHNDCAGFQNCKYEDICEGNQLRQGYP